MPLASNHLLSFGYVLEMMEQEQYFCTINEVGCLKNRRRNSFWKFRLNWIYLELWTLKLMNMKLCWEMNTCKDKGTCIPKEGKLTTKQKIFVLPAHKLAILHHLNIKQTIISLRKTRFTTHIEKCHHIWLKWKQQNWGRVRSSIFNPLYVIIASSNVHGKNVHLLS